jgi:hypothetical protein
MPLTIAPGVSSSSRAMVKCHLRLMFISFLSDSRGTYAEMRSTIIVFAILQAKRYHQLILGENYLSQTGIIGEVRHMKISDSSEPPNTKDIHFQDKKCNSMTQCRDYARFALN